MNPEYDFYDNAVFDFLCVWDRVNCGDKVLIEIFPFKVATTAQKVFASGCHWEEQKLM